MMKRSLLALRLTRSLSTQPAVAETLGQAFRTQETDPCLHSNEHVGRFYSLPEDVCKTTFGLGGLPETFKLQAKTFTETCIMVRQPAIDVMNYIRHSDFDKPVNRFVIYGRLGTGKSLVLAHLLHYASLNDYLLFHVPWAPEWIKRVILKKEMVNSSTREGFVDLPLDAANWLIHFKKQNAKYLKEKNLTVSKEYIWSRREKTEAGSPLVNLIDMGINRYKFASDIVVAIAEEIKLLSKNKVCKTFVAIDGFNVFFNPSTNIKTPTKRKVLPKDVTLTSAVLELTKNDWCNGIVALVVDNIASTRELQDSMYPRYLLGKEGFELLDPFVPIEVKNYTEKEFLSCMMYYRDRLWVRGHPEAETELAFTTGMNPYSLMSQCAPL